MTQSRFCTRPVHQHGGAECVRNKTRIVSCNTPCPSEYTYCPYPPPTHTELFTPLEIAWCFFAKMLLTIIPLLVFLSRPL